VLVVNDACLRILPEPHVSQRRTDREGLVLARRSTDVPTLSRVSNRAERREAQIGGHGRNCVDGSGQPVYLETS
jgi:hypothetical protein